MKEKKEKTKVKKIINIIEYCIVIAVILFNSVLVFKSVKNPNKSPDIFGIKAFVIISGSMSPEIKKGDMVLVKNTEDVVLNQVIAFRNGTSVIVHRIVEEMIISGNKMFKTKGDNNAAADIELVSKAKVEGFVFNKIPFIGTPLLFLYNNLFILVVVVILCFIIKFFLSDKQEG